MIKKEFRDLLELYNYEGDWEEAHIIYKEDNWDQKFTEKERTYKITKNNNFFVKDGRMISNALLGDCLDGLDLGVRLDWYDWDVERIIIVK